MLYSRAELSLAKEGKMPENQAVRMWDEEADVIVVGFGGAGACAALQAAQNGAKVLVLDRFHGGGATSGSGGIIYAGGGTRFQKEAGYDDTTEEMYNYLKQEVGDVVSDETLRRFCEESPETVQWLEEAGVPFEASLAPYKTSYPTDQYYLYFSGNEKVSQYTAHAKPAPRGHRAKGPGISGQALFQALEHALRRQIGIRVRRQTDVQELVVDDDGRVIGVRGRALPRTGFARRLHALFSRFNIKGATYALPLARLFDAISTWIAKVHSKPYTARAKKGVILAAGGFIFNKEMVKENNPTFLDCLPLGTFGDDGAGIKLGRSVGGTTARMDRMSAWRFYVPPEALIRGVLVDGRGERICNEYLYGAKQGDCIIDHGGMAHLVFDADTYKEAVKQIPSQCAFFQWLTMVPSLLMLRKKAQTLSELARKIGVPVDALEKTMREYNESACEGQTDPMGKTARLCLPQIKPPFYAINNSIRSKVGIPTAALTLGGLRVNEETGQVLREDGSSIDGLYAAGRNAVGICSNGYFASGTSISDCIFAGRRAGRHAAATEAATAEPASA